MESGPKIGEPCSSRRHRVRRNDTSTDNTRSTTESFFTGLPSGVVPYVAILAVVSAYVHLSVAPMVSRFDPTQGILFVLAGLGFVAGIGVYLSRYWREFYLVAIVFALAQVAAFSGMGGRWSEMAIASKAAEGVFAIAAAYLYATAPAID